MDLASDWTEHFEGTGAPVERDVERLDVRNLGPPNPLVDTLETLTELADSTLLLQVNDRAPQHLYPKLEDRGYEYATVEAADSVLTAIWKP
jgi:uncharacterized protein (DUF2249 family)